MSYYFFDTTRKYIGTMMSLFDNIIVQRTDGNQVKVPLVWASKQREVMVEESDGMNTSTVIPKMALSMVGMNFDTVRKTNKLTSVPINIDVSTFKRSHQYNSVPYNFDFMLQIVTKSVRDQNQIIEQILPYFNPSISLNIHEIPGKKPSSIIVTLSSVDIAFDEDLGVDDDSRMINGTLNFTLKGNLYMPIKDTKLVKEIETKYGINENDIEDSTTIIGTL